MSTSQTTNYQLNLWEPQDAVLREDFNTDNRKIDEAIAELAARSQVIVGTYTGDGNDSQLVSLGATPKAVFSLQSNGYLSQQYQSFFFGGLALEDHPVKTGSYLVLAITEGGFIAYQDTHEDIQANNLNTVYHYLALI